jgi:hypothetical protein
MNGLSNFITVSKGMCGYFICLADNDGPIERLDDWNYDTYDRCSIEAEKLANAYNVRFV